MSHAEQCPICKGTGVVTKLPHAGSASATEQSVSCHGCGGRGWVLGRGKQQMNQQEIEALAMELAGMRCQRCDGKGIIPPSIADLDPAFTCPACHGAGYLFPGSVRIPCNQVHDLLSPFYSSLEECQKRGCRGWTASLDFVTWWDAAYCVGYELSTSGRPSEYVATWVMRRCART